MAVFQLLAVALTLLGVHQFLALRRNLKLAKTINLPYIILPWYTGTITWFILSPIATPILRFCLPSILTRKWIDFISPFWTWYLGYKPFEKFGSDALVTVSPGGITFHCCSPEIISEIGVRRKDFLKPLDIYTVMNTFGPNIVSTDGPMWRHQRKIMAPSFNEERNSMVWSETIHQTKCMLSSWEKQSRSLGPRRYLNVHDSLRIMTFNVIARGAFGDRFPYPGFEDEQSGGINGSTLEGEHKLRFGDATLIVVSYLKFIFVLPTWVMRYAPWKFLNRIWLGLHEMGTYLEEYISERGDMKSTGDGKRHEKSILSSLIDSNLQSPMGRGIVQGLTGRQIIGNVFNSVTAGHETTGSTLFYCLINLAIHPEWQRKMQADIDLMFDGREPSTWSYLDKMDQLFKSSVDAVVRETLRLYPPNNVIPKHSTAHAAQILRYKGKEVNVPPNSRLLFLTASTHRNPRYWPHGPDYEINAFHPERWFLSSEEAEKYGGRALDLHPSHANFNDEDKKFFNPKKGAFVPWSIGHRDCIGRKFAHVEILVALVCISRGYRVELAVEDGETWEVIRERAKRHMKEGMKHYTTMQLGTGLIPLRIVKRGEETFR